MMADLRKRKGVSATCPACDTPIHFRKKPGSGQLLVCRECDSLLRVFSVSPLRLTWAFREPLEELFPFRSGSERRRDWWDYDDDYDYGDADVDEFSVDDSAYGGDGR
jgi:hypothetical protein